MASHPGPAWTRLGELLMRRRVELDPRYRNRRIFTAERAVEYRIVNDIELGRRQNYEPGTIAALEAAYAVTAGSIGRALEGGNLEPQSAPGPHLTAVPPLPAGTRYQERGAAMFPDLDPDLQPEAVPRYDDYEARIILAAMETAAERGITLDAALAEPPDAAAVFPEPALEQERTWWSTIQSRGLPSRPYTYQELAHRLAALRVLWDHAETGQSSAGAGLAVAAPLPADGWIKPGIPP